MGRKRGKKLSPKSENMCWGPLAFCVNTALKKKKKELKQNFYIAAAQTGCYMNHHKTGNPQNLRLYAESKGSTLQVAGSGWSSPVYGIETKWGAAAEPNSASKPSSVVLSWGRWEGKALCSMPPRAEGHCFTFLLHRMKRPALPMWSVLTLLSRCDPAGMCVQLG